MDVGARAMFVLLVAAGTQQAGKVSVMVPSDSCAAGQHTSAAVACRDAMQTVARGDEATASVPVHRMCLDSVKRAPLLTGHFL